MQTPSFRSLRATGHVLMCAALLGCQASRGEGTWHPGTRRSITIDRFLGVLHVYGNARQVIPSARDAGMSGIHGALNWSLSQRTPDAEPSTWSWAPTTLEDIATAGRHGMDVELVIGGEPPAWSSGLSNEQKLHLWARYCQQVASRFDGRDPVSHPPVQSFTILSEFNCSPDAGPGEHWWPWLPGYEDIAHLYVELYTTARRAIKAVRPEATVMIAGPSGTGVDWLTEVFALLDPDDYPEAVNCHPFHRVPEEAFEDSGGSSGTFLTRLAAVREQVIERYYGSDADVRIWLGECGGYTTVWCSEEEQARYAMRQMVLALSTQYVGKYVWAMIWHDFDDPEWIDRPGDWWGHTGFVKGGRYRDRSTWTPKPIHAVVGVMRTALRGATYEGRRPTGADHYAFDFRRPDGGLLTVAWSTSSGGSLEFPARARPRAYTWLWTSRPMNEVGQLRTVQLSGQPCYVVSELN